MFKYFVFALLMACGMSHDVEHRVTVGGEAEVRHKVVIDQSFCDDYGDTKAERKDCLDLLLSVLEKCQYFAKE